LEGYSRVKMVNKPEKRKRKQILLRVQMRMP
jgi:hypothetical protein